MISHRLSDPTFIHQQLPPGSEGQTQIDVFPLIFDWNLSPLEISRFRGAICQAAGKEAHLFHNHDPESGKVLYRYPRIQYRLYKGKALLLGLNKGANELHDFLGRWGGGLEWKGDIIRPELISGKRELLPAGQAREIKTYIIKDWLALNQENFRWWCETPSLSKRLEGLEKILVAQLLMMAQGLDWQISWDLQAAITHISRKRTLTYRKVPRIALDLEFQSNIDLPKFLAVGKAVSEGFGRIWIKK